jgi:hypothetical protein
VIERKRALVGQPSRLAGGKVAHCHSDAAAFQVQPSSELS